MSDTAVKLEQAVKEYRAAQQQNPPVPLPPEGDAVGLVQSLINEFGLGMEPRLRRACYERLARLESQYGQAAELLIAEARSLARAPGIRQKGNYFARAAVLKLREAGLV